MRRRDLLGAGAAAAAVFPWLRRARGQGAARSPRLVLVMQQNGVGRTGFWPAADLSPDGTSLAPLLADARLRERTTVIKGLYNHDGGVGTPHDWGFAGLWSGYRTLGRDNEPIGGGPSLDQVLKARLAPPEPFPTLACAVLASDTPPVKQHRVSFSYRAARQLVPSEIDPYKLYGRVFPAPGGAARLQQKRSVLDFAAADLRALRGRLGAAERERLDAHESALRAYERGLSAALGAGASAARCAPPPTPSARPDLRREDDVPALVPLMLDFIALALACGMTRVVNFQLGAGGERWYYRWLGIGQNFHDEIAHADFGTDLAVSEKVDRVDRWHAEQVAYLARALDAFPEGDGTALDASLIAWGNEMATGTHTMDGIPVVLVGRAAGRLVRTGRLVDQGPQDYHRLGCSVLGLMGAPADGFGEAPACGPIAGLV